MCGRYTTNTEEELIEIRDILNDIAIRITNDERELLNKEVTPGSKAPIITKEKELKILKWGFVKWDNKGVIFNARSETVEESNYFNKYLKNGRCVVPASNYFEWERKEKAKIKYEICESDKDIIYFAGIIKKEVDGSESYTILTKKANEDIEFIHERMPLLLKPEEIEKWLDGELSPLDVACNTSLSFKKCE